MSKRSYDDTPSRKKSRIYSVTGYDRSKGGVQYGGLQAYRARLGPLSQQSMRTGGWANPSLGGELKFIDTNVAITMGAASVQFVAPGPTLLLNGMANGSDASSRIGRKVVLKSLLIRWTAALSPTSTGGSPIRILCIYDKQANATAPSVTDILLADNFNSANNLSNRDRFVTLCDYITEPVSANGDFTVSGAIYKKINLETMFNTGSAGTIGDITSGSVYLIAAQTAGVSTAAVSLAARSRIRYTDV